MSIQTKTIEYYDNDTCLEGFFAVDDSASTTLPAVLIAHAWAGRDEFVCDKAHKLAELGYAAFALDVYGKGVRGNGPDENAVLMQPFMEDRTMLQRRMAAALQTVQSLEQVNSERIAAMGFCFGGLCVLDLARSGADVRGVISFHGLLGAPENTDSNSIKAKVLVLHGREDPLVPPADVPALQEELTRAGCDWQLHIYGSTMHAFTNPVANDKDFGTVYDAVADRRSWRSLLTFLEEVLA